jgi:hypothetical protein
VATYGIAQQIVSSEHAKQADTIGTIGCIHVFSCVDFPPITTVHNWQNLSAEAAGQQGQKHSVGLAACPETERYRRKLGCVIPAHRCTTRFFTV